MPQGPSDINVEAVSCWPCSQALCSLVFHRESLGTRLPSMLHISMSPPHTGQATSYPQHKSNTDTWSSSCLATLPLWFIGTSQILPGGSRALPLSFIMLIHTSFTRATFPRLSGQGRKPYKGVELPSSKLPSVTTLSCFPLQRGSHFPSLQTWSCCALSHDTNHQLQRS